MSELARVAGPVACLGLALLLVAPRRELRLAGFVAWAAGAGVLALHLAPSGHEALLAGAAAGGLALAAAGAWGLLRWPWALAFATLLLLPARIPVTLGEESANLLLPLYGVVAAAALALGWRLVRGDARVRELGRLSFPLAALVAWIGLSLLWTDDLRNGSIFLLAFVLPFGLLAICFARLPWRETPLLALYGVLAGTALAYAGVGIYQWLARDVFWNPKVIVPNAYAPFFRVNSVFWDPSIYGRYLVLALLTTLALLLVGLRRHHLAGAIALIAVVWVGLLFSFSQSSFLALIAGVLAAATVTWRWRAAFALGVLSAAVITAGFATPQVRNQLLDKSRAGINAATSSRAGLVANGIRITRDNPVLGVGVGSFKVAYAEQVGLPGREPRRGASHTAPVTVAAETGLPGLVLLGWLGVVALAALLRGPHGGAAGRTVLVVGLTLGAIAVHSLFYAALFEDPTTWALLGLAALALAQREREAVAEAPA
ncbi:MAG TPA: O-antigen ligase family protein [Gaiellaceae bacterium]|nr:O-antigen ligase family protein [Gaiellaceae bacterium]